jgi:hypothetical protein
MSYPNPDLDDLSLEQRTEFAYGFNAEGWCNHDIAEMVEIREQIYDMALMIYQADFEQLLKLEFSTLDELATSLYNMEKNNA